jgi:hypothetical protein
MTLHNLIFLSVIYLRRNGADLFYVNSTDRRIVTAISNMNITITPRIELNNIDRELESSVDFKNNSNCRVHEKLPKHHKNCSGLNFEKNYFHEESIIIMVKQILAKLQWNSLMIFYENSTGMFEFFIVDLSFYAYVCLFVCL